MPDQPDSPLCIYAPLCNFSGAHTHTTFSRKIIIIVVDSLFAPKFNSSQQSEGLMIPCSHLLHSTTFIPEVAAAAAAENGKIVCLRLASQNILYLQAKYQGMTWH